MNLAIDRFGNATLVCVSLGGPQNQYQWQYNGSTLTEAMSDELNIFNVVASDGGVYTCIVSNGAGTDSDSTYLFVNPYFVTSPDDLNLVNGSLAVFLCNAEAFPSPGYQWGRVDGEEIRENILTTARELVFSVATFGDEGGYYCNASSRGRVAMSSSAILTSKIFLVAILLRTYIPQWYFYS